MTKPNTPAQLVANINGGCRTAITAGINGNLPQAWQAYDLMAMVVPALEPTHVVVTCSARRPDNGVLGGVDPGAKFQVEAATADHLRIADQLADQLRQRIAAAELARRRTGRGMVSIALADGAKLPERKTPGSSGYDLCALAGVQIQPGRVAVIETGVTLEIPTGMEAQIRPRSGMASRGIVGTFGTVDSDYRAAIRVMLTNQSAEAYRVEAGDRVAQLVFSRVEHPEIEVVDAAKMTLTERGPHGLGSTGR